MPDVWASGDAYEPYVGRWSRLVAAEFVDWLDLPGDRRWLDVGCGTGALSSVIAARCEPAEVLGVDPSEAVDRLGGGACRGPSGPFRGRRRHAPARRAVRRRRFRTRAQLRPGRGRGRGGDARRHTAWLGRRLRVGLRRPDGAHASFLGRRRRT